MIPYQTTRKMHHKNAMNLRVTAAIDPGLFHVFISRIMLHVFVWRAASGVRRYAYLPIRLRTSPTSFHDAPFCRDHLSPASLSSLTLRHTSKHTCTFIIYLQDKQKATVGCNYMKMWQGGLLLQQSSMTSLHIHCAFTPFSVFFSAELDFCILWSASISHIQVPPQSAWLPCWQLPGPKNRIPQASPTERGTRDGMKTLPGWEQLLGRRSVSMYHVLVSWYQQEESQKWGQAVLQSPF